MSYITPNGNSRYYDQDSRCLEIVTTCVGFDDMLDVTLEKNHAHVDNYIVVTTHEDKKTQQVAHKHGAMCVQTDLFKKNGRNFNKGAAINAGFDYFQYYGWRMHLDVDIVLPDNFKRILFNHSHLKRHALYGADRFNIIGNHNIRKFLHSSERQHKHGLLVGENSQDTNLGHRLTCKLRGYLPLGFFQLWHCSTQKPYPYSLGTAAHDDMMFSALWPEDSRFHLPSVICYHLCPSHPKVGQNWDGERRIAKLVR